MEIGPLTQGYTVKFPQAKNQVIPSLPCRMIVLSPSSGGKTTALVTMLTDSRFYKNKISRIFWCSPTATIDPSLNVLRDYIKDNLDHGDDDPAFHDFIDVPFLTRMIERQKKVTEYIKAKKAKQNGFNIMIVLDDLADSSSPESTALINSLFIKARHYGVSVILSTQKLKLPLITPCTRVNATAIMIFRIRSQTDLNLGILYELSALVSKDKLYAAYQEAVAAPYGFIYVNLLAKSVDHMFYSGFGKRFKMSDDKQGTELQEESQ
jgi:hypothetical protein